MSETRYTDADKAEPGTVEAVEQEFEVELAGLNENEQDQVHEALTEAEFGDSLEDVNIHDEIHNAEVAEELRDTAESERVEQARDADAGDVEGAKEHAMGAEAMLNDAVNEHGGQLETAAHEATHEVQALSDAQEQLETAETFEEAAVDYSVEGQDQAAEGSEDFADDAYDAADNNVEQADAGGTYGDQSIHTDV
ncbi:MAG: hypothetical protein AB8B93_00070 [Pseudomonadales bacterium]